MVKIDIENDKRTITEIEESMGIYEFPLKILYIFILVVILSAFTVSGIVIGFSTSGEETRIVGSTVSFNVVEAIGCKKVSSDEKFDYYLVFGNQKRGFSFVDLPSGIVLYKQTEKPNEGVSVKVSKKFRDFTLMANY